MPLPRHWFASGSLLLSLAVFTSPTRAQAELGTTLEGHLATVAPQTRVPIYLVLHPQLDAAELEQRYPAGRFTPQERRDFFRYEAKQLAAASQAEVVDWLHSRPEGEVESVRRLWLINAIALRAQPSVIARLRHFAEVKRIMLSQSQPVLAGHANAFGAALRPSRPSLIANTWNVDKIRAPQAWASGITGKGVLVASVDTGSCYTHPDLEANIWRNLGEIRNNQIDDDGNGYVDDRIGWDFGADDNDPMDDVFVWHGTHTVGTIAGRGTLGKQTGIAPDAQVLLAKPFVAGFGTEFDVWEAFQYALDHDARILNGSFAWTSCSTSKHRGDWRRATDNAAFAGMILVFGAGNDGATLAPPESIGTPADVPAAICVGAVDANDDPAAFSSPGPTEWGTDFAGCHDDSPYTDWEWNQGGLIKPDFVAPGVDIDSTIDCGRYSGPRYAGTSYATPHVSGVIALMLEAHPLLSRDDVVAILAATAIDLGPVGKDNQFGWGRIDALDAVTAARNSKAVEVQLFTDESQLNPGEEARFVAIATNTTGQPQSVDLWADVSRPNGAPVRVAFEGPKAVTVPANGRLKYRLGRIAPITKSQGTMLVTLKVGSFGLTIDDADSVAISYR